MLFNTLKKLNFRCDIMWQKGHRKSKKACVSRIKFEEEPEYYSFDENYDCCRSCGSGGLGRADVGGAGEGSPPFGSGIEDHHRRAALSAAALAEPRHLHYVVQQPRGREVREGVPVVADGADQVRRL